MRGHSGGNKALEANPNHTNNTQTHLCHHSSVPGLIRWVVWLSHFKQASKLLHKQSESGPLHREYLPSSISSTAHCDTGERKAVALTFQRQKQPRLNIPQIPRPSLRVVMAHVGSKKSHVINNARP